MLKLVRPRQREAHPAFPSPNNLSREDFDRYCRQFIVDGLQAISRKKHFGSGVVRTQLLKFENELRKLSTSTKGLPDEVQSELRLDAFLAERDRINQEVALWANRIKVTLSGGNQLDAARMRLAAERAFDLLVTYAGKRATLTRGGKYHELTSLLFELATGKKARDPERACRACLEEVWRGNPYWTEPKPEWLRSPTPEKIKSPRAPDSVSWQPNKG